MPSKRRRRDSEELARAVKYLADLGPFTAQDLATRLGVTENRSRQILEAGIGGAVKIGKRPSARGKPAVLWGARGNGATVSQAAADKPQVVRQGLPHRNYGNYEAQAEPEATLDRLPESNPLAEIDKLLAQAARIQVAKVTPRNVLDQLLEQFVTRTLVDGVELVDSLNRTWTVKAEPRQLIKPPEQALRPPSKPFKDYVAEGRAEARKELKKKLKAEKRLEELRADKRKTLAAAELPTPPASAGPPKKHRLPAHTLAAIRQLSVEGLNQSAIAARLGVSWNAAKKYSQVKPD